MSGWVVCLLASLMARTWVVAAVSERLTTSSRSIRDESYEMTWAKTYRAESCDEWDNKSLIGFTQG